MKMRGIDLHRKPGVLRFAFCLLVGWASACGGNEGDGLRNERPKADAGDERERADAGLDGGSGTLTCGELPADFALERQASGNGPTLDRYVGSSEVTFAGFGPDRVLVSTEAHWLLLRQGDLSELATDVGRALFADPNADWFLVLDGTGRVVERRAATDGQVLSRFVPCNKDGVPLDLTMPGSVSMAEDGAPLLLFFQEDRLFLYAHGDFSKPHLEWHTDGFRRTQVVFDAGAVVLARGLWAREVAWIPPLTEEGPHRGEAVLDPLPANVAGRLLSVLPEGDGFVTNLGGVGRAYRRDGSEQARFDLNTDYGLIQSCLPAWGRYLACTTPSGFVMFEPGRWDEPVVQLEGELRRIHAAAFVVIRSCPADTVSCNEVVRVSPAEQGGVEVTPLNQVAPEVVIASWADDGTMLRVAADREVRIQPPGASMRTLLWAGVFAAVSPKHIAVATTRGVLVFSREDGRWLGELPPVADLTAPAPGRAFAFSPGGEYLLVALTSARRRETAYAQVWRAEDLTLVASVETPRQWSDAPLFTGWMAQDMVLRGWRFQPPAFDVATELVGKTPSLDGEYDFERASGQVVLRRVSDGALISAFDDTQAATWLPSGDLAVWMTDSVALVSPETGRMQSFKLGVPGQCGFPLYASEARVCGGDGQFVDFTKMPPKASSFEPAQGPIWEHVLPGGCDGLRAACEQGLYFKQSDWHFDVHPSLASSGGSALGKRR